MNRINKHLFAVILLVCLNCSCGNRVNNLSYMPVIDIPLGFNSMIEIKKWIAIGPFEFDTCVISPSNSFLIEDLKQFGIEEGWIDRDVIKRLKEQSVGMFFIDEISSNIKMFKYTSGNIDFKSNFYLAAKINSKKAQDVSLIIDGSNSYSGWLNGEKIVQVTRKHSTLKVADRIINVSLKEGENTLFFKVNRGSNKLSWSLICSIATLQEAKKIYDINYANDFVWTPFVTDSIEIYAGPYLSGRVEVADLDGSIVASSNFDNIDTNDTLFVVSGLSRLSDGFYNTILTIGTEKKEELIYKGDYNKFIEQVNNSVTKIIGSGSHIDDLKASLRLVNNLKNKLVDTLSFFEKRYANRTNVFWGYTLHRILNNDTPPTQIMTYRDERDCPYEFIFHSGNKNRQGLPLIIILPYEMQTSSLLEDWYVSNLDLIEAENLLADQYGFMLAYLYVGGKNYSAKYTEKEITAVINRLAEYNIDNSKIFILGECEGGRRAFVQLTRSPGRYAGCAVIAPITLSGGADGIPINLIPLMKNTPILVMHGVNDDIISVEGSRKFVAETRKSGLSLKYVETDEDHVYMLKDQHKFAFEFFNSIITLP